MCPAHWRKVPYGLQVEVYATYVAGQERRKDPTADYLMAAERAIVAVSVAEGLITPERGESRLADYERLTPRMAELFSEIGSVL